MPNYGPQRRRTTAACTRPCCLPWRPTSRCGRRPRSRPTPRRSGPSLRPARLSTRVTSSTALTPYAVCSGDAAPRDAPYKLGTAPPARRALAERLPPEVASAAPEFIVGPLRSDPRRVGKPLGEELAGIFGEELADIHSARLGREWRVRYEIDDTKHVVVVLDIRHRSNAY